MNPARKGTPNPNLPPGAGGLYTIRMLAERLGVTVGTMRGYVHAKPHPAWLPEPQRLGNELAWTAEALNEAQIDSARPSEVRALVLSGHVPPGGRARKGVGPSSLLRRHLTVDAVLHGAHPCDLRSLRAYTRLSCTGSSGGSETTRRRWSVRGCVSSRFLGVRPVRPGRPLSAGVGGWTSRCTQRRRSRDRRCSSRAAGS